MLTERNPCSKADLADIGNRAGSQSRILGTGADIRNRHSCEDGPRNEESAPKGAFP